MAPYFDPPLFTKEALNFIEDELEKDGEYIRLPFADVTGQRYETILNPLPGIGLTDAEPGVVDARRNVIKFLDHRELQLKPEGAQALGVKDLDGPCVCIKRGRRGCPALDITEKDMMVTFEQAISRYLSDKQHMGPLRDIIQRMTLPATVDKVICFGLGRMTPAEPQPCYVDGTTGGSPELKQFDQLQCDETVRQHAFAWTVGNVLLKEKLGRAVPVYVQDPAYTSICKAVLRRHEFQVIDCFGARGFTMVDDNTVVITMHPNVPVRKIIAEIARPAAMFWRAADSLKDIETWAYALDPDSSRTLAMSEGYETIDWRTDIMDDGVWCYKQDQDVMTA